MSDHGGGSFPQAARDLLLEQFAVQGLLKDLSLVDRFLLDVLVVPTPRIARAVMELVRDELPSRRGEAVKHRVLMPDPSKASALNPVTAEEVLEGVLWPLVRPDPATEWTVTWVDASTAGAIDEDAWRVFFARLNERRNVINAGLPGPMVLVLPTAMERLFAHSAPDAWSVRTGVYRVQIVDVEVHPLLVDPGRRPSLAPSGHRSETTSALSMMMVLGGEESAQFDEVKRSWVLVESVERLLADGRLDEAEVLARESIARAESAVAQEPASELALRGLFKACVAAVDVVDVLGDEGWLRELLSRALEVAELLYRSAPNAQHLLMQARARRGLSLMLEGEARLTMADAAVADATLLVKAEPPSNEAFTVLAQGLEARASAKIDLGLPHESAMLDLDDAIKALGDGGRFSSHAHYVSGTAITTLLSRSALALTLHRYEQAEKDAKQALQLSGDGHHPLTVGIRIDSWIRLAESYAAAGHRGRQADSLRSAFGQVREARSRWPQSRHFAYQYVLIRQQAATLAWTMGQGNDARRWYADAVEALDALAKNGADDPDLRAQLAALKADMDAADHPSGVGSDPAT